MKKIFRMGIVKIFSIIEHYQVALWWGDGLRRRIGWAGDWVRSLPREGKYSEIHSLSKEENICFAALPSQEVDWTILSLGIHSLIMMREWPVFNSFDFSPICIFCDNDEQIMQASSQLIRIRISELSNSSNLMTVSVSLNGQLEFRIFLHLKNVSFHFLFFIL